MVAAAASRDSASFGPIVAQPYHTDVTDVIRAARRMIETESDLPPAQHVEHEPAECAGHRTRWTTDGSSGDRAHGQPRARR